ncbi:glycolate oxidase subunit GlcE [Pseudazoarcus pumilus]|uniref:Glycolate oxidase subunit GlcE n=1 Tax=Pseudazoarcus pumilus TaxID=2067960 RepID=A0A2I6S8M1_9RHOO|nr:glycolate oxidase subunit GlcE [Pseudazoarcus pumilus]AUN95595.1 glycolate oxidase subunit GlcE [Pseudazoarcus pumilus]
MSDIIEAWRERVRQVADARTPLRVRGGGSKDFYGREPAGEVFDTRECAGIVAYEPTELVVTVRAGTPLAELDAALAEKGQWLAFEPPHFGDGATVGGMVATGLSGPRRMAVGSLRDFVLGMKVLDGRGDVLSVGGQVMKNVAGYDVSRLMTGALGTLGVIVEVSLKVLPRPVAEATLALECDEAAALAKMNEWGAEPLPVSATAWHDGVLRVRLSGARAAVDAARQRLGGEALDGAAADAYWEALREQRDDFFGGDAPLWRFALPTTAAALALDGAQYVEWGGGQRWLRSDAAPETVRERATALGGHATLFRGGDRAGEVFQRPSAPLMQMHRRLKAAFDPAGILNPGRMYAEL